MKSVTKLPYGKTEGTFFNFGPFNKGYSKGLLQTKASPQEAIRENEISLD